MSYSLVILKPDAVERNLHGFLIAEAAARYRIHRMDLRLLTPGEIMDLYREHADQPYWERIEAFMVSGPSVVLMVEGDLREVREWALSVRGRLKTPEYFANPARNVIHATERLEDWYRECDIFFPGAV